MQKSKSKLKTILTLMIAVLLISCGNRTSELSANANGFNIIESELINKFGDHAYYTDVTITYNKSIGNIIGVTVTEDPESLKMGQWNLTQDNWAQNSNITLEVPEGSQAADFMFQLDGKISLSKLGELVEKSCKQLKAEKNIENPVLNMAFVKFPKNGNLSKAEYEIMLQPEFGGTMFLFRYELNGELVKMDY